MNKTKIDGKKRKGSSNELKGLDAFEESRHLQYTGEDDFDEDEDEFGEDEDDFGENEDNTDDIDIDSM